MDAAAGCRSGVDAAADCRQDRATIVPKDPLVRWMIVLAVAVSIGFPLAVALVLTFR